jgi:sugar phosphate isomerase/epimerase
MGYEGVEFFGEFTRTAQELKAALKDTGLVCCGWHTPWHYVTDSFILGTVTYNKIIGNTDIVVPALPREMTSSKEAWLKTAEAFNAAAEKLAGYGMHIGYHNHGGEFKDLEGGLPFHYFYDNTKGVGMQFDNGNAWTAGPETDVYDPLTRYPGRAKTLHLKPFSLKTGHATMIGEDDIDWPKFFDLSYQHQPVEWYIVEYECEDIYTQLEGIDACLKALKKMEAEGAI